jgi:hypothetical protein
MGFHDREGEAPAEPGEMPQLIAPFRLGRSLALPELCKII